MEKLFGRRGMVSEVTEQDIEKAEQSTKLEITQKDIEEAESSTKPNEPEQDIDKAESSTMPKEPEQDIDKAESSTMPKEPEQDTDIAESSARPESTVQDDVKYAEILAKMKMLIDNGEKSPKILGEGEGSCCIFKIPQSLAKIHHKGYEPEIVSIGPYHHGDKHLQMIEAHKHRFLQVFLKNAKRGVDVNSLGRKILKEVTLLKNSYSENLDMVEQHKLLKMMLLDGCFILMLFFSIANIVDTSQDDPILMRPWILATIRSDLLLLENQVPLILLQTLFGESKISLKRQWNLKKLAFEFFNLSPATEDGSRNYEAKHLLDLIRKHFIPIQPSNVISSPNATKTSPRLILSAKRLRLQGIKFKAPDHDHSSSKVLSKKMTDYFFKKSTASVSPTPRKDKILEIKLDRNELHIPPLLFDGFISSVLLNCVAFEQISANCSNHITSYVVFMRCLVNDKADAIYLTEKGIIENYFGNASDVSQFFKNVTKDIAFDMEQSYLQKEFEGINEYTSNRWNKECATFKHLHFDSPWTLLSSIVVLVAISLSIIQTTLGVLKYLQSNK